jgi:hypothetical protein
MGSPLHSTDFFGKVHPDSPAVDPIHPGGKVAGDPTILQILDQHILTAGEGQRFFEIRDSIDQQEVSSFFLSDFRQYGEPAKGGPGDLHLAQLPRKNQGAQDLLDPWTLYDFRR